MKNYTITVNGTAYDVTVEENNGAVSAESAFVQRAAARTMVVCLVPEHMTGKTVLES